MARTRRRNGTTRRDRERNRRQVLVKVGREHERERERAIGDNKETEEGSTPFIGQGRELEWRWTKESRERSPLMHAKVSEERRNGRLDDDVHSELDRRGR